VVLGDGTDEGAGADTHLLAGAAKLIDVVGLHAALRDEEDARHLPFAAGAERHLAHDGLKSRLADVGSDRHGFRVDR